jgi:hypothetical protein
MSRCGSPTKVAGIKVGINQLRVLILENFSARSAIPDIWMP